MAEQKISKRLRVGIVGMGPVGSTLAVHLKKAGGFVVGCDIDPKKVSAMKEEGVNLINVIEASEMLEDVCQSIKEMEMYNLDLVVLSVKTPVLKNIAEQLKEIATDKMYVMCAQNGIDNEAIVSSIFGEDHTLRMVINYAGNMSDDNTAFVSFFNPPNYIAALMPKAEPIAMKVVEMLNSVDLKTEIPADIQDYVWEKAILNAALSAVCAVTRKTMKEVMDFDKTQELVEALVDESIRVAEAEGIDLGKKFRRFSIRYLKSAGDHRPSMLVDLESGRRTEIDHLNGKIVDYGRKHYIPTPLNLSLSALIHMMEFQRD